MEEYFSKLCICICYSCLLWKGNFFSWREKKHRRFSCNRIPSVKLKKALARSCLQQIVSNRLNPLDFTPSFTYNSLVPLWWLLITLVFSIQQCNIISQKNPQLQLSTHKKVKLYFPICSWDRNHSLFNNNTEQMRRFTISWAHEHCNWASRPQGVKHFTTEGERNLDKL